MSHINSYDAVYINILYCNKNIILTILIFYVYLSSRESSLSRTTRLRFVLCNANLFVSKRFRLSIGDFLRTSIASDVRAFPPCAIMRNVLQNRYVLINMPLPHSPGAITAIITGPHIFSACGLPYTHTNTYEEEQEEEEVVVVDDATRLLSIE